MESLLGVGPTYALVHSSALGHFNSRSFVQGSVGAFSKCAKCQKKVHGSNGYTGSRQAHLHMQQTGAGLLRDARGYIHTALDEWLAGYNGH